MAKILIAEDERDIRELVNFILTFAGHELTLVSNGADAVELAQKVIPDMIMMDVRMPRLTGYEACRQMKTIDSIKHIPVVFLTAKGGDDEIEIGKEVGAFDYILKPFTPDELTQKVAELLQRIGIGQQ